MPDNRDVPAEWSDPANAETAWEFEGSQTGRLREGREGYDHDG